MSQENNIEKDDQNQVIKLLTQYRPYWPLFIILCVITLTLASVYLRYATPTFEITASILVKDEKKGVDDSGLMEQLNLFGSKKLVENEIEVIQSRTLISNVVKNLSLYAPISTRGRVKSNSAYEISPVKIIARYPDSLIKEKERDFAYDSAHHVVVMNGKQIQLNTWINDSINIIEFLPNPKFRYSPEHKPLYFSLNNVQSVTQSISKELKAVQATKLSSVIDLTFKDNLKKKGEDVVNNLIDEYNKASLSDKNALATNTLKFVSERLDLVSHELDSVEKGIQKFKTEKGVIDIGAQGEQYLESVSANDQKLSEVNVQLAVLDKVQEYVVSRKEDAGIVPSTFGVDNQGLSTLLDNYYQLSLEYEKLKKTTAENNPISTSVAMELAKIRPHILENVENLRGNLNAAKENLTRTSEKYSTILSSLPLKERALIEISRQQAVKNTLYSFLLQKREETALNYNASVADSRIIDSAESTIKPISPKKLVVFAGAILLAIVLGVSYVSIREIFNRTIMFRNDIEKISSTPIAGEIMYNTDKEGIVVKFGDRSIIAEQFRQLRTSLSFFGVNKLNKTILLTSTISGEGKSFIAANLGMSLALIDKRVVLLELDLRKPKLAKAFTLLRKNTGGMTNYLIGNKSAEEVIYETEENPNLFIIPSGAIPPNPSELLSHGRLEELLHYLQNSFDFVIIDTAPVLPVTDAYILSPLCDMTMYIVRHAVTPKQYLKSIMENLKTRSLKNVAIVFNGIKNRGMAYSDYGYGYGINQSYTYVDEKEDQSLIAKVFKKNKSKV